jgi:hypothetical protein
MRRNGDRRDRNELAGPARPLAIMGLVLVTACQEPNPEFDGPAASSNGTSTSSTTDGGPDTGPEPTGPVVTGDGTTGSTTDTPPGTTTDEPPGTSSSGEPAEGSTTGGCMGMICADECVDVMTNDDHCGRCDNKCVGQQECIDGDCMVP